MNTPTVEHEPVVVNTGPASYLSYLNGIRGASALYIVIYHCWIETTDPTYDWIQKLAPPVRFSIDLTSYGYIGVDILVVLSGYCLMLPISRSPTLCLRGGIKEFIRRRSRRILPPYYIALLISLLILALVPWLHSRTSAGDMLMPMWEWRPLLAHFLLLHCWRSGWMFTINSPMWTLSLEWQIYFLFVLFLLPACRRFGIRKVIAVTFLITWVPFVLLPRQSLALFCPWLIGLFTLGMAASLVSFSAAYREFRRLPWNIFALVCCMLALIGQAVTEKWPAWIGPSAHVYVDPIVGLTIACLLVHLAIRFQQGERTPLIRLFSLPPLMALGRISYSLYLTHAWVIALTNIPMLQAGIVPPVQLIPLFCVVTPLCIVVAYLFHLLFERPFQNKTLEQKLRTKV